MRNGKCEISNSYFAASFDFSFILLWALCVFAGKFFYNFRQKSFPQIAVEKSVENSFFTNLNVDFQMTFSTLHILWAVIYESL